MYAVYSFMKIKGLLPKKSLKGKHVFLTGAGSGLGRMLSVKLAKLGCKLSISDLVGPTIQETKRLVKEATGTDSNVNAMTMDVSNRLAIS
jgi:NAD(P)-dependent dehydrogenase (short-subunit alcohol dehydrogenase family)